MDIRTGLIKNINRDKLDELDELKHMLEISEKDMTKKQKKTRKVSLKDHTSILGKKLTEERRKRGFSKLTKNQRRNLRRKLKAKG